MISELFGVVRWNCVFCLGIKCLLNTPFTWWRGKPIGEKPFPFLSVVCLLKNTTNSERKFHLNWSGSPSIGSSCSKVRSESASDELPLPWTSLRKAPSLRLYSKDFYATVSILSIRKYITLNRFCSMFSLTLSHEKTLIRPAGNLMG